MTILTILTAAAVICAGASILFLSGMNDETTTTVKIIGGLRCTINGESVTDGQEITVGSSKLDIHVESASAYQMRAVGSWTSDKGDSGMDEVTRMPVESADFSIQLKHGKNIGRLAIINLAVNDSDIRPIHLAFTIDDSKLKVTSNGTEIRDGDVFTFPGDGKILVESLVGAVNISYSGQWSNDYGMSGGGSGSEFGENSTIFIEDSMFFDDGHGTMKIYVSK